MGVFSIVVSLFAVVVLFFEGTASFFFFFYKFHVCVDELKQTAVMIQLDLCFWG